MLQTNHYTKSICHWPQEDRPREKLLKYGEEHLSNSELLAILLRTGVKGHSAVELARKILTKFKTFRQMAHADSSEWSEFKGLGDAKIAQIKAALEIGRRFRETEMKEERPQMKSSRDLVAILMPQMRDLKVEVFKTIILDSQNRLIEIVEESRGTVNFTSPIIREIFQKALQKFATSIICVHNHPSGQVKPSDEDISFTKKLVEGGRTLGVPVLDHLIIGNDCYYSFADDGKMG
jgi:DNA repair protein RadC